MTTSSISQARPVEALHASISSAKIDSGSVFRGIDRRGNVSRRALDPKAVNDIVRRRVAEAGLEHGEFSAHGLRSGYLTEAANRRIPLLEAMEQSRHCSVQRLPAMITMPIGERGPLHACSEACTTLRR